MKKELGIFVLLIVLCAVVALMNPRFLLASNLENTATLVGMYGIFSIGLGLVIITGGIDLSVGSLFALQGVVLGMMLGEWEWHWAIAAVLLLVGTMGLGLTHGLLITRARMQPFIVTLCGLLIYRGAARYVAEDRSIGFGIEEHGILRWLQSGKLPEVPIPLLLLGVLIPLTVLAVLSLVRRRREAREAGGAPARLDGSQVVVLSLLGLFAAATVVLLVLSVTMEPVVRVARGAPALETIAGLLATGRFAAPLPFVLLVLVSFVCAILLHGSVYGRYLYAVGRNEEATRFSGVNTKRVVTSAYVLSAALAAISGLLFAFYSNAITPASHASFYELFGIAAAVLGGCSLRGGEGSILGIVLGVILIQVLQNLVNLLGLPSSLNFAVMGAVILLGVMADQLLSNRTPHASRGRGFPVLRLGQKPGTTQTPADTDLAATPDTSSIAARK